MITNPKEWVEVSDNIVAKPFKYGFLGAVSAAILLLMNYFSLVNLREFGFYFLPVIHIIFALSTALIIWGICFYTYALISKGVKTRADKKAKSKNHQVTAQKLLENLDRLSDASKRLMCEYIQKPSGRFLSPDRNNYGEFHTLLRANLVNIEDDANVTYNARRGLTSGTHCRVNYALYSYLKETDPDFAKFIAKYLS